MAQLLPFTFDTPGIAGLNLQGRTAILGQEWATRAKNLVIDEQGRLAHRLGTRGIATNTTAGDIETMHVGVNSSGTRTTYCADSTGAIYELVASAWVAKYSTSLPSNGNWKFANFNSKVVAWHADGQKVVQASPGSAFTAVGGTSKSGVDVLAAWGYLWVIDGSSLYISDLLIETTMTSKLILNHVWPAGVDTPVGLAEFNGHLVIFGKRSIVIYQNPGEATLVWGNFVLAESIEGIGCIERDTIQNVGKDIFFLSADGIKSLSRVIQEKSLPLNDAVPQGRSAIMSAYTSTVAHKVTSAYSESTGLYVLGFAQTTIAVDVRQQISDGVYRFTEWDTFSAMHDDGYGGLLMATDDDALAYTGVLDGVASDGSGGVPVQGDYESGWIDFSNIAEGAGALLKFIKRIKMYVAGGSGATIQFKWLIDYQDETQTVVAAIPVAPNASLYGVAQYGIAKYGTSVDVNELSKPASRGGRVIKVGFLTTGSTTALAVNQIDVFAKVGKQST